MGDLEFHYQKVEEAKQQGIEEGKQMAAEESKEGGVGILVFMVILILGLVAVFSHGGVSTTGGAKTANVTKSSSSNSGGLPGDIGEYISNDATRFYKYTGNDGVTYVRHHYEPNDQLSKQGYFKSSTGEYILLTMSFYPQNDNWVCNWRVDHAANGRKETVSNGADVVYAVGVSSENCVNALVQALTNYGYDSVVSTSDGTEITPLEGRGIIYG